MKSTWYDVLGVNENASEAEIREAYRREAMKWHPDRNKSSKAPERMAEINEAWRVLHDPASRARYDAELESARKPEAEETVEEKTSRSDEKEVNGKKGRGEGKPRRTHAADEGEKSFFRRLLEDFLDLLAFAARRFCKGFFWVFKWAVVAYVLSQVLHYAGLLPNPPL